MSVLSTMVFADISGSTALYEALGNERATEAVTQVTQWIGDTIEAHGGRVVKKLGDGVLGVFGDASSAVSAMATMLRQHKVRLDRWPHPLRMEIRVGVASGEVVDVDGDCYGDAVNVASRLCERAGPAEIWATETTVLLAGTAPDVWYRKLGMMDIRGKAELLMLYHVEWREDEAPDSLTMQAALVSNFAPVDSILGQIQFSWHGVDRTFTSSDAPVMVGRAEHAQLRINDPRVSRLHARIDWRNSGFVLTDMSSFGTWVRFEGSDSPVRLRRDACILHGAGHIALGVSFNEPSAPVMSFHVAGGSVHLS
ncbi:class 3 adenylate cyclase [Acidovorax sp. 93]|jgi:adenylate cyclase|uniref:Adenylate/guanylate cyclase domain-containing protein n=1 Tax=Acidovorax facilis TaxID=12917 RepID=A0ABV8DEX0_9BURK|nr:MULTISPECIES: adenylate/guanylate cyclase domain-containing protein [Acidovorax]MBT9442070.1 adenylate/guanylate cyclase domain-containing protein [Acidovorax sp.]ODS66324.1 MAG: adenylate cyclase [Acidovorax sp. SCN 65-108]OGA56989.1 MAG: adenylate cyclase [Burkholderiales bacterium RIFCSPHIGHO2_01_FULL_64_960]OGA82139.1 MAG: adenylate cyclase [Burkholderiales bacterium GWA2_64_37]OGB11257.1 MAG: adenylate cyclase [Burkholderiales bacterium RIFCSPHIGHO2_02_FULL_64_19]OGB21819.1 MAG: adeny